MSTEIKRIPFADKKFQGKSGTMYHIQLDDISTGRFQTYERLALKLAFGLDFKSIFSQFAEIYKLGTSGDETLRALHAINMIAYQQMNKIRESGDDQYHDAILFCTIFCNSPGEDLSQWDMELAKTKMDDWVEYSHKDFFLLSRSGIEGYTNALAHLEQIPNQKAQDKLH